MIRTMTRCQAERGLEVHVATTDDNGPGQRTPSGQSSVMEDNVTYWIFPRQTRFYLFSFPLTRWLWKHTGDYDVVHIHTLFSYASVAAALCARLARVPYIVRPLGTLSQWGMRNRRRWLKRLSFRLIESRILKDAASLHYTSEQEALEAQQLGVPHKYFVIPNPVEIPCVENARGAFRSAYPELAGRTIILFFSRLDQKKGLDLLLPAFARVRAAHPEVTLVIAGDGESSFVVKVKQEARRLAVDSGIVWTGFLRGKEKYAVLADADLYVLPAYSENFGVAVVEAMGAGLPVIVSDQVGIHREISQTGAGLVVGCTVEELEAALTRAINDDHLRSEMGANAVRLAKTFAPEAVTSQMAVIYDQLRGGRDQLAARQAAQQVKEESLKT